MNKVEIKTATPLHLADLANLFKGYCNFYQTFPSPAECRKFIQARLSAADSVVYMGFIEHRAVGFVQIYPSFSSVAMRPIWILNDLYVKDDYRRLRVATSLLRHVEVEAKKKNIFAIKLATQTANSDAQSLYTALDYSRVSGFELYSKKV